MKTVFRQQVIQVVAGDATGDGGEFFADQISVLICDLLQRVVDLIGTVRGAAARYFWAAGQPRAAVPTWFIQAGYVNQVLADFQARAVVGDDF